MKEFSYLCDPPSNSLFPYVWYKAEMFPQKSQTSFLFGNFYSMIILWAYFVIELDLLSH